MNHVDRVRVNTPPEINARIDAATEAHIRHYATCSPGAIAQRIGDLEREWDIERWLEANAAGIGVSGLLLALLHDRRWLLLPGIVMAFMLQHAVQGWCPPVPLLRRLGVRTRKEIEQERYALKVLRGDFAGLYHPPTPEAVLRAINR